MYSLTLGQGEEEEVLLQLWKVVIYLVAHLVGMGCGWAPATPAAASSSFSSGSGLLDLVHPYSLTTATSCYCQTLLPSNQETWKQQEINVGSTSCSQIPLVRDILVFPYFFTSIFPQQRTTLLTSNHSSTHIYYSIMSSYNCLRWNPQNKVFTVLM